MFLEFPEEKFLEQGFVFKSAGHLKEFQQRKNS